MDEFIFKVYGQKFSSSKDQEVEPYNRPSNFTVFPENEDPQSDKLLKFIKFGEYQYSLGAIMHDLCKREFIEKGNYKIFWF